MNIVTVYTALKFSYFTKEKVFGGPNEMTEQVRDFGVQTWGPKFKCLPFHTLWLSPRPGGTTTEIKSTQVVIKLFFWKRSPSGRSTLLLWKSLSRSALLRYWENLSWLSVPLELDRDGNSSAEHLGCCWHWKLLCLEGILVFLSFVIFYLSLEK